MNYTPARQMPAQPRGAFVPMRDFPPTTSALPKNPVVAMAYVPFQTDTETYDEVQALACGTLFPCLHKPFKGSGAR